MAEFTNLIRPYTLFEGQEYIRVRILRDPPNQKEFRKVKFVGYESNPEFVIVKDEAGRKIRIPRAELYIENDYTITYGNADL
jgi:hypothetical protein